MASERSPPRSGNGGGSTAETSREPLPRLTEVVPDYEELSPFYQRPNSAPAAGVEATRHSHSGRTALERQRSDLPPSTTHPPEAPLPPLRAATVRTYPGAGSRQPYQNPFELTLDPRPGGLNIAIERSQSDRPPLPRRQTTGEVPTRSPTFPERPGHSPQLRPEGIRPSVYDPIYEPQRREEPPRRASRSQLPPMDVGATVEPVGDGPAPQYQPLPPLRTTHPPPPPGTGSYPPPPQSPRYTPYTIERPPYEQPSRRRYSQTDPRNYPRPPSPYHLRSPPPPGRGPALYPQDPYPPSYPAPQPYNRGARRPSVGTYPEERRPSRQETLRYQAPIPYGSSYPPSVPYEYSGGRGYYDPYQGYIDYPPDSRRLSQQEPGEQVSHLGVPERSYRPPMLGGPSSPSSIRVQPPHGSGMSSGTPGKRRGNLPKESKEKLKQWLSMHVEHPYPTEEEKKDLAAEAGMTMGQINNWFINARRRTLPRIPPRSGSPSSSRTLRRRPGDS